MEGPPPVGPVSPSYGGDRESAAAWARMEQGLLTFQGLVEQQHYWLLEMQEVVRQTRSIGPFDRDKCPQPLGVAEATEGPLETFSSGAAGYWPSVSCKDQQALDSGMLTTITPSSRRSSRRQDSWVMPMPTVYHHGNGTSTVAGLLEGVPSARDIPSMQNGLFPFIKGFLTWVVDSHVFEPAMACIIALNAINTGIAIDLELKGKTARLNNVVENYFAFMFGVELVVRLVAKGHRSLMTPASALDALIIVSSLVQYILKAVLPEESPVQRFMSQIMLLRVVRLLRLARSARLVACLESVWKLAQGLMRCVGPMFSACLLMFITIYIFACFGAECFAKPFMDDPVVGSILRENFSSMPKILLTLFQFVAMDSTAGIYYPLILRCPWLAFYFWLLLMTVPIALMNLITAILVEDVISTVQADEEMKQIHRRRQLKQLNPALKVLFKRFDTSNDGRIQIKEVSNAIREGLKIPEALQDFLDPARMLDLFDALDSDNSGDLSETEFIDGLTYASMTDVDIEVIQILHLLRSLRSDYLLRRPASFWCSRAEQEEGECCPSCFMEAGSLIRKDSEGALAI